MVAGGRAACLAPARYSGAGYTITDAVLEAKGGHGGESLWAELERRGGGTAELPRTLRHAQAHACARPSILRLVSFGSRHAAFGARRTKARLVRSACKRVRACACVCACVRANLAALERFSVNSDAHRLVAPVDPLQRNARDAARCNGMQRVATEGSALQQSREALREDSRSEQTKQKAPSKQTNKQTGPWKTRKQRLVEGEGGG